MRKPIEETPTAVLEQRLQRMDMVSLSPAARTKQLRASNHFLAKLAVSQAVDPGVSRNDESST